MMNHIIKFLIIYLNLPSIFGANILVFFPLPLHSHLIAYKPLFKELALRGHNVTFYTITPFKENIPNLKQVIVKDILTDHMQEKLANDGDSTVGWRHILLLWEIGIFSSENLLKEPPIKELIHSTDLSFDLILMETFFVHETFAILGHKFNAPIVNLHPLRAEEWISDILRNPQPLSYVPNFRLPITERMTFFERTVNSIYSVFQSVSGHYYYIPILERIIAKYVKYPGSENLPPLLELLKNTSLTLLDGNRNILFSSPSIPTFIPVGGIHILPNKKLPADLEKFINDSSNGIVYFSLGSMVKLSTLPTEKLKVITKVLGSLPQRVLVKWEINDKMPGQPENVLTSKWFPQLDILAHSKCRAFVTHGGIHSILEAAHFGVPIVGIPVFSDQESNLMHAKKKGFAQILKLEELSVQEFSSAIDKVINDRSFKKSAEAVSKIIKDVPMSPLETAVFWVEHVIRHKGAEHLQIAGRHLPWYQYYLLDVIFAAVAVAILTLLLLYKLIKPIFLKFLEILKISQRKVINGIKVKRSKTE